MKNYIKIYKRIFFTENPFKVFENGPTTNSQPSGGKILNPALFIFNVQVYNLGAVNGEIMLFWGGLGCCTDGH